MRADEAPADMDDDADAEGEDAALRSVPLADLFLALGASFLFALFLARPELRVEPAGPPDPVAVLAAGALQLENRTPLVLLAGPGGVRIAGEATAETPLAALHADAPLGPRLRQATADGQPILLAIEPGGEEAAFLLDPVLAGAGEDSLAQIRLDRACGFLQSPARPGVDCLRALGIAD